MSSWRKFADSIIDISKYSYFRIVKTTYSEGKFIIITFQDNRDQTDYFNINFETQQEAMEYLIKALREDICP